MIKWADSIMWYLNRVSNYCDPSVGETIKRSTCKGSLLEEAERLNDKEGIWGDYYYQVDTSRMRNGEMVKE